LKYSKGSAGEIRSMLYVALDLNYISKSIFDEYYKNVIEIITQISNFIKYRKNYSGKK